jgi:uncharacterized protein (TIGR00251 family)
MSWHRYDPARRHLILTLHVQPNARRNEVAGPHGDALKVRIAAPAVDNQANAALVKFLAERLGVPRSSIAIRHGTTGRRKIVEIAGDAEVSTRLPQLGANERK